MNPDTTIDFEHRNRIFDEVFHGRMKPEEAELEARRFGLPPYEVTPSPAAFDPMSKAVWTLAMSIAWICWRSVEEVRECWDEYRRECWDWHHFQSRIPVDGGREWEEISGWELKSREPATLTRLSLMEAFDDATSDDHRKLLTVREAREALWEALAEGSLAATALQGNGGRPIQVPAHEWPYLVATADGNLADQLRFESSPFRVEYRDVTLRRADLCRLWPAISVSDAGEASNAHQPSHQERWQAAVAWLTERVDAWRNGTGKRLSRSEVEATLRKDLNMNSPMARKVWEEVRPPEWEVRGRRRNESE